jgi:hypothetical protein
VAGLAEASYLPDKCIFYVHDIIKT